MAAGRSLNCLGLTLGSLKSTNCEGLGGQHNKVDPSSIVDGAHWVASGAVGAAKVGLPLVKVVAAP